MLHGPSILTVFLFKLFELVLGEKSILFANKEDGKRRRKLYNTVFNQSYVHHYYAVIQEVNGAFLCFLFFLKMKYVYLNFCQVNITAAVYYFNKKEHPFNFSCLLLGSGVYVGYIFILLQTKIKIDYFSFRK